MKYCVLFHRQNRLPAIKMSLNLPDVNDDCLLELKILVGIFTLPSWPTVPPPTFRGFRLIACEVFSWNHKLKCLDIESCAQFNRMKSSTPHHCFAMWKSLCWTIYRQLTADFMKMHSSAKVVKFQSNDYPLLQSLALNNPDDSSNLISLIFVCVRHPNLIELELRGSTCDLSLIGECCPSLIKLTIWCCDLRNIAAISQLDKLTALKLCVFGEQSIIIAILNSSPSS